MPLYTKDSLERLRQRIDLVEVLTGHMDLKRAGVAFKGLCPFHEEKTPSFMVQRGDTHYHCYGCGAHGDAIQFLMSYLKLGFAEAVESLGEKFNVPLELEEKGDDKAHANKALLKDALECASLFFHAYLLHTLEGHEAMKYLVKRGVTVDFVKRFEVGFAPQETGLLRKVMHAKHFTDDLLVESGLLGERRGEFFRDRITFPIRNASGQVIGFSARKYKEETFGGKYINSPETPIFKKSRLLFGLNYARRRIAKERKVVIVEGQIDCLKMIEAGFTQTVAALGTAFGEGHVRELKQLGVRQAVLLFDSDAAGATAASKVGNLFQKAGIETNVVSLPDGMDPDAFLLRFGPEKLAEKMEGSVDYLTFQVGHLSKELNAFSPAGKTELIKTLKTQISEWEEPVMVHESLKKVAQLTHVPEDIMGIEESISPSLYIKKSASLSFTQVDPHRVLELDLLRWLILAGDEKPQFLTLAKKNLLLTHFWVPMCQTLYKTYLEAVDANKPRDLLSLFISIHDEEAQHYIEEVLNKKINRERAEDLFHETVQKLLDRQWLQEREEVKRKIHSGKYSEDEVLGLAKQFDELKKNRPAVTGV